MKAVARYRNCSMSARKMRLVIDLVRGKDIDEALNILRFTKKEAATVVEKTLISAISNWEVKTNMTESADDYELYISEIFANEAGMLKRYQPAPHGRAHRIRKRMCHLNILVENRIPTPQENEFGQDEEE